MNKTHVVTSVHKEPSEPTVVSTSTLMRFFVPELITVAILYLVLDIINFQLIACTDEALCNATIFVTNSLLHVITKVAEGFSIGLVIICGQYNGAHEYEESGRTLSDTFWINAAIGAIVASLLYLGAPTIYSYYDVPDAIARLGVPYLRIRAIGTLFLFLYFPLIGFLRGIQNPKMPMIFFGIGAVVYLFFDYALIFGMWGFPELGLTGSALAAVAQYGAMLIAALIYILLEPNLKKFSISFFRPMRLKNIRTIVRMSWPVMIDKASLAIGPVWINKMIGCTALLAGPEAGHLMFDTLTILKTIERIGLLPAIALAQVITYLVSNDYKIHFYTRITNNVKKVLLLAVVLVMLTTLITCLSPEFFLGIFNPKSSLNSYTLYALQFLAFILVFDVIQLILAAALRGASQVQTVMTTRLFAAGIFLIPFSYGITLLPIDNLPVKFLLLYSASHVSNALMGCIYLILFKRGSWKTQKNHL